jgi:hypothetical protein
VREKPQKLLIQALAAETRQPLRLSHSPSAAGKGVLV